VVLNPNNGDVLAMVSAPSFNPNAYIHSKSYRQSLLQDPSSRTFNRAVFGQYPPGSTFKPISALGVLKAIPTYGATNHVCNGYIRVSRRRMNCWAHRTGGHGKINLRQALMHSCNVYMFEMAMEVGFKPIHDMAKQFGIGQFAGLLPDLTEEPAVPKRKYGNLPETAANKVDLCNMAIGQGAITASPLQMAMVASTIANGGTLYRPRLVKQWRTAPDQEYKPNPTWAIRRIDIPMPALELVRGGMYDVVMDPHGTAKKARVPGIKIAGKTGSAQYRKKVGDHVVDRVQTWMISYAPFDFPRYAIAFLVEDGSSGGKTVGPRLSALYQKIFEYDGTLPKGGTR
jgi:penicillin-binding protein 2